MSLFFKWLNFIAFYYLAKVPVTSSPSFLQSQGKTLSQPSEFLSKVLMPLECRMLAKSQSMCRGTQHFPCFFLTFQS